MSDQSLTTGFARTTVLGSDPGRCEACGRLRAENLGLRAEVERLRDQIDRERRDRGTAILAERAAARVHAEGPEQERRR